MIGIFLAIYEIYINVVIVHNYIVIDFSACANPALDSLDSLDSLYHTYSLHMFGCELWNLNCDYVSKHIVGWSKIKR